MKKFFSIISAFILCLLALPHAGFAQPGALDHSFNPGFNLSIPNMGTSGIAYCMARQPDGKILCGGAFPFNNASAKFLMRINEDGTGDETFSSAAINSIVYDIKLQADGKIIVAEIHGVVRLNADGSLDPSFSFQTTNVVRDDTKILLQSNGKIILNLENAIVRLNTDGSLDTGFGIAGYVNTPAVNGNTIALQADDKIIYTNTGLASNIPVIFRLDANGNSDASFNCTALFFNGEANPAFYSVLVQPDGKILISGVFSYSNDNNSTTSDGAGIVRLNSDGSTDGTFTGHENGYDDNPGIVSGLANVKITGIQPDGKIVITEITLFNSGLVQRFHPKRLNTDGSVDPSLIVNLSTGTNGGIYSSVLLPNGKIIAGGYMDNYNGVATSYIVRLKADGSLDNGTGANGNIYNTVLQPDGKILILGNITAYNGVARRLLARVNTDGSLDESFDAGLQLNMPGGAFALQSDGKIITNTTINGIYSVSRLNADGSIDNSFTSGIPVVDAETLAFGIQADGKILVSGRYSNGAALYRLNTDGSLDNSFLAGTAFYNNGVNPPGPGAIYDIYIQPDGKIIVSGAFTSYNGVAKQAIAKLNSDGSIDNSFDFPASTNFYHIIYKTALQQDGKVLIYGQVFVPLGGASHTSYDSPKRLNSDGTADGSFNIDRDRSDGDGFSFIIPGSIAVQPDGKILITATHLTNDENFVNAVFRFNTDGSFDDSFEPGSGFRGGDPRPYTISIQSDGKIISGGGFLTYDGTAKYYLARILNTSCASTVTPSVSITASPSATICSGNIIFTATPVNGGSLPAYRWFRNGVEYASINGPVFNHPDLPMASGDIITCKLISNEHCVSSHNAVSNGITVTFITPVTPFVAIALTAGSNPVCTGNQLTFTATPTNGGSNPTYQWKLNGSTNIGSNSPTLTYNAFTNGNIVTCVLTNNDGCTTQASNTSNSITVNTTDPATWYLDADGDGYSVSSVTACGSPGAGYTTTVIAEGDCDDNNGAAHQQFVFYLDEDHDGHGSYSIGYACAPDANTAPVGYSVSGYDDCNDNDPGVWQQVLLYYDGDGDGYYGSADYICYGNTPPAGYLPTTLGGDCDDNDNTVWQTVNFYTDNDGDGYTTGFAQGCFGATFTYPPGYNTITTLGSDCNDNDNSLWQGGPFMIDNDEDGYYGQIVFECYGATLPPHYYHYDSNWQSDCDDNDNTILAPPLYYADADGDGYGNINASNYICGADHIGYVLDNSDCDDTNPNIHPGAVDICNNGIDEDCNGTADDQPITYYADTDGDGYGDPLATTQTCDTNHPGYVSNSSDCDDTNDAVHPGAAEITGDGIDNDCDGLVDVIKLFRDSDNDSRGDVNVFTTDFAFPGFYNGFWYIADSTDCDDNNYTVYPGAAEICDGLDNDCNGTIDDNVQQQYGYRDADGDGYADLSQNAVQLVCNGSGGYIMPPGYVYYIGPDCDDTNAAIHPGATENLTNGIDDDCDGLIDVIPNNCEWNGSVSSNWHDPANWDCNAVPTAITVANIPEHTNQPVLSADAEVFKIFIPFSSNTLIDLNDHALTINGLLQYGATIKGSPASSLIFKNGGNGYVTMDQSEDGASNALSSLVFKTNNDNNYISLQNKLVIVDSIVPTRGILTTANALYLRSTILKTASILRGKDNGNYINGQVTVERYIPANSSRAWRMLSIPTYGTGQTIHQSWQEDATGGGNNPHPGYGTNITAPAANFANGFDYTTQYGSILQFDAGNNRWNEVTSTNISAETRSGYSLYIRGDRTATPSSSATDPTSTILRTTGNLYLGTQVSPTVPADKFGFTGNIYAAAIDFTKLVRTPGYVAAVPGVSPEVPGVEDLFYVWDPKKLSGTTLGAYQTFSSTNGFECILGGGSFVPGEVNTHIESGQAFFVHAKGADGTVTFNEDCKVAGSKNVFRPSTPVAARAKLTTRLNTVSGTVADANVVVFDIAYANEVNGDDALKLANTGENFAILRDNKRLVIEGRQPVMITDTLFFAMWNMQQQQYLLEFVPVNLATGLTAYLEDSYRNTSTPVDLTAPNTINFTVDANAASSAGDRFRIVFRESAPLPLSFISISANQLSAGINVAWKVAGERGIGQYEIERSADGINFTNAGTVNATGNLNNDVSYNWLDATAVRVTNFYRIKSTGINGEIRYSSIVKLSSSIKPSITVSPNPVEGNIINLQFSNEPKGRYTIRLLSSSGQSVFTKSIEHGGGNSSQALTLPSAVARGAYQLEIIDPGKEKQVQTLIVNSK